MKLIIRTLKILNKAFRKNVKLDSYNGIKKTRKQAKVLASYKNNTIYIHRAEVLLNDDFATIIHEFAHALSKDNFHGESFVSNYNKAYQVVKESGEISSYQLNKAKKEILKDLTSYVIPQFKREYRNHLYHTGEYIHQKDNQKLVNLFKLKLKE